MLRVRARSYLDIHGGIPGISVLREACGRIRRASRPVPSAFRAQGDRLVAAQTVTERNPQDQYMTPAWAVELALDHIPLLDTGRPFLEPCAGTGAFVSAVRNRYPNRGVTAVDIDARFIPGLKQWTPVVHAADFRGWARAYRRIFTDPQVGPDVIITNPPFSTAVEIMDAAFLVARPDTQIVMFLRSAFMESQERHDWWKAHEPDGMYTLSRRPKFRETGGDRWAYAYFVWRGLEKRITVL